MPAKQLEAASVPALMPHVGPVKVLTPPQGPMHIKIAVMGGTRNVRFRDPQLGPSCDDVLNDPSERKDSSDCHSQRDDHDWKHDKTSIPSLDSMSAPRPLSCVAAILSRDGDLGSHRHRLRGPLPKIARSQ
jgi:hypothetical protein